MLIVRFIRADDQPAEEYYSNSISEAVYHILLFRADDSGLYKRIELIMYGRDSRLREVAYALNFQSPVYLQKIDGPKKNRTGSGIQIFEEKYP